MKLLLIVFLVTGTIIGPFTKDLPKHNTPTDWLVLAAIHVPAVFLAGVGLWQAKSRGRFMGLDVGLFSIVSGICYGAGVAIGFWMEI